MWHVQLYMSLNHKSAVYLHKNKKEKTTCKMINEKKTICFKLEYFAPHQENSRDLSRLSLFLSRIICFLFTDYLEITCLHEINTKILIMLSPLNHTVRLVLKQFFIYPFRLFLIIAFVYNVWLLAI